MSQQLVRLHVPLSDAMGTESERESLLELEEVLEEAADSAGVGDLDGNEIGGSEYTIWLYGPDAAALAEVVKTAAIEHGIPDGCSLFVRYGSVADRTAREETIAIS